MITGNPRAGRRILALSIILLVAILTTVLLLANRKRNDPQNVPPLVPHGLLVEPNLRWQLPELAS